jgi:hypothetical protein
VLVTVPDALNSKPTELTPNKVCSHKYTLPEVLTAAQLFHF